MLQIQRTQTNSQQLHNNGTSFGEQNEGIIYLFLTKLI